jgi:hypothetical protein
VRIDLALQAAASLIRRGERRQWQTHPRVQPFQPLARAWIGRIQRQHIFQADLHVLGIIDNPRQPEPGALVARIGFQKMEQQRTGVVATPIARGGDCLVQRIGIHTRILR